jgi:hypothetical protein
MKEMKVKEYGGYALYTYMKENSETFCHCFRWGRERMTGGDSGGYLTNVQCKAMQNCHNESPPVQCMDANKSEKKIKTPINRQN